MEARGNGIQYPMQYVKFCVPEAETNANVIAMLVIRGSNYVRGSLNWGPAPSLNRVWKTYGWWTQRRASYGNDFHTYALEWTEDFMYVYV
jgi:hypothetical protein